MPVLAAAVLAAEDVSFLLAGSAAQWLHGESIAVADADVVIEPGEHNLHHLGEALARMALRPRAVPPVRDFPLLQCVSIEEACLSLDQIVDIGTKSSTSMVKRVVRRPQPAAFVMPETAETVRA